MTEQLFEDFSSVKIAASIQRKVTTCFGQEIIYPFIEMQCVNYCTIRCELYASVLQCECSMQRPVLVYCY